MKGPEVAVSSSKTPELSRTSIKIGVALKWVAVVVEVDPLTGATEDDERLRAASPADLAALECGLRLAHDWSGEVTVATAGPPESEPMLRAALAAGANKVIRCDLPLNAPSETVASGLADAFDGFDLVLCGDRSLDRGSGSVPSFLAARLNAAQALGLASLRAESIGCIIAERRLGAGRRERLRVRVPAVLSVEGAVARLRRASLSAVLVSQGARIEMMPSAKISMPAGHASRTRAYRPRARAIAVPDANKSPRERVLAIAGTPAERARPQALTLSPGEAADYILAQLREWGYFTDVESDQNVGPSPTTGRQESPPLQDMIRDGER